MMIRVKPGALADNQTYDLLRSGAHGITLKGSGNPNTAGVYYSLRDSNTRWTLDGYGNSDPAYPGSQGGGSTGSAFFVTGGNWANLFLICEANADPSLCRLTVAMDDGTSFAAQTSIGAPTGFNPLAEGFDNPTTAWYVGSNNSAADTYDGLVESIVIWDKALSNTEAAAIGLTNAPVPEPALGSLLLAAGGLAMRRRGR